MNEMLETLSSKKRVGVTEAQINRCVYIDLLGLIVLEIFINNTTLL